MGIQDSFVCKRRVSLLGLATLACACSSNPSPSSPLDGSEDGGSGGGGISGGSGSGSGSGAMSGGGKAGAASGGTNSAAGANTSGAGGGGMPTPYVPKPCAEGSTMALPANAPKLATDRWTEISPPVFAKYAGTDAFALTQGMTLDPCNPSVVYVCVPTAGGNVDDEGLWRSSDAGATWELVRNFGSCVNVRVNPENPLHLYVGDGVAGGRNGLFVSMDGGKTFAIPAGFDRFVQEDKGVYDVYHVSPDPTDFNHVLLTFHSPWADGDSAVAESFDGGATFRRSKAVGGEYAGGYGVFFLYEPSQGIGDAKTWLFGTQGKGYYRTTDAGETWTKVSDVNMTHGGATVYYSKEGVLYVSGDQGAVLRSTDNGQTFTTLQPSGTGSTAYLSVIGDGKRLYAGNHGGGPFFTALESDDTKWSQFNEQMFAEGPFEMVVDHANGIVYSANIRGGVWALKMQE